MSGITLYQFRFSPYNEKVRWALDYKGIAHRRVSLLPGPHIGKARKLSGQSATPILVIDSDVIAGSADILDEIERRFPDRPLGPAGEVGRARAAQVERIFDDGITPKIRRAVLAAMIDSPGYMARCFAQGHSGFVRVFYGLALPFARGLIKKGNGITGRDSVREGEAAAQEALDWVVAETAATGYLFGTAFSRADLVVAAHLAPLVDPPHADMQRPSPMPRRMRKWLARWRAHPGAAWVMAMYAKHRPPTQGRNA